MSQVKLTFIGSGDAFGSGGKNNTCFLVESRDCNFLIDCGATSLVGLKKLGYSSLHIDHILVTHLHGDHFGGIPFIFLDAAFVNNRDRPLSVICPEGGKERIVELTELLYPGILEKLNDVEINFLEYDEEETTVGPLKINPYRMIHSDKVNAHGLRIKIHDKTISYSGDTAWSDKLFILADEADLFICECNFYNTMNPGHLNYHMIRQNQDKFNCKKMILTHLGEEMLTRLDEITLDIAEDGLAIEL